ncbi:hypothetical protein BGX28_006588 [Mortierella sp. GBA30]|nr:hypothetical protein BGX28_006588 [Mortierella sp. GBA30]
MSHATDLSLNTEAPDSYSESISHLLDLESSGATRWLDMDTDTGVAVQQAGTEAGSRSGRQSVSAFGETVFSRADVVAGLIVLCIGALVLIVAVTFYFVRGRAWRSSQRTRSIQNEDIEVGSPDLEYDLQSKAECSSNALSPEEEEKGSSNSQMEQKENSDSNDGAMELEPSSSPSTARLVDPPTRSIFSFLKGTYSTAPQHRHQEGSNRATKDDLIPASAMGLHMPALTRIKARSNFKQKKRNTRIFFNACTAARDSDNNRTNSSHPAAVSQDAFSMSSPSSLATSASMAGASHSAALQQQQQQQLQQLLEDSFSPNRPSRLNRETAPVLPRLDMTTNSATRSSSVMGLYGSARSSPNGSMVDAASTRAIYCASLKSAMSFATTNSQAHFSGSCPTDGVETGSKEIVLATAEAADAHDESAIVPS